MENQNHLLRQLPKVDEMMRILQDEIHPQPYLICKRVVQQTITRWRERILAGEIACVDREAIQQDIRRQMQKETAFHLKKVINATGIVLHTNLGRANLSEQAAAYMAEIATGYTNLEYDLETGARGSRYAHVEDLLTALTGAEAALVVNNNAAAVLLVLDTLTKGKEVIVSRGELVEIGGAFRVPAIMERSGCKMVEVGTTNKTHAEDYRSAINEQTGAILKVHTSNYRVIGFTSQVSLQALWEMGCEKDIPVIYDLGSGMLTAIEEMGSVDEPLIQQCVPYADILCFSGDKLLGGPQAGIIVGRKEAIGRMKKNHLLRALRIDKFTLAGLEYTLRQYLGNAAADKDIPILQMLKQSPQMLAQKWCMLTSLLHGQNDLRWEKIEVVSQVGGGSLPDVVLPSVALGISSATYSASQLEEMLRQNCTPIIARIHQACVLLDMRTIDLREIPVIADCLNRIG